MSYIFYSNTEQRVLCQGYSSLLWVHRGFVRLLHFNALSFSYGKGKATVAWRAVLVSAEGAQNQPAVWFFQPQKTNQFWWDVPGVFMDGLLNKRALGNFLPHVCLSFRGLKESKASIDTHEVLWLQERARCSPINVKIIYVFHQIGLGFYSKEERQIDTTMYFSNPATWTEPCVFNSSTYYHYVSSHPKLHLVWSDFRTQFELKKWIVNVII